MIYPMQVCMYTRHQGEYTYWELWALSAKACLPYMWACVCVCVCMSVCVCVAVMLYACIFIACVSQGNKCRNWLVCLSSCLSYLSSWGLMCLYIELFNCLVSFLCNARQFIINQSIKNHDCLSTISIAGQEILEMRDRFVKRYFIEFIHLIQKLAVKRRLNHNRRIHIYGKQVFLYFYLIYSF